jgi:hypothetical protein
LTVQQNLPDINLKSLGIDGSRLFTDHNSMDGESDESQQDDLEEELIPIFTFRKYNNRKGNHSNKGRLANFNWPWFGNF